jgi:hypothetical protein
MLKYYQQLSGNSRENHNLGRQQGERDGAIFPTKSSKFGRSLFLRIPRNVIVPT